MEKRLTSQVMAASKTNAKTFMVVTKTSIVGATLRSALYTTTHLGHRRVIMVYVPRYHYQPDHVCPCAKYKTAP